MICLNARAPARHLLACIALAVSALDAAWAQTPPTLGLNEASDLAIAAQPLLLNLDAQARASRESAVAAGQLPDPQVKAGLMNLPVDTGEAYSFRKDSDTAFQIGLSQEFTRGEKRRLRGELLGREADRYNAEEKLTRQSIRRDSALAWLEAWRYQRLLQLTQASQHQAEVQMQLVEIALRTNSATQAEYLSARLEVNRLKDAASAAEQGTAHSRSMLSRWIGDAAWRPISDQPLQFPALPNLDAVLARVNAHPSLGVYAAKVASAQSGIDLAKTSYAPDWRAELAYSHRPAYSNMVSVQVGIDLPFFTGNRQDRNLAAALAQKDAAETLVEDQRRQLIAEARLNHHDFNRLQERIRDYDLTLIPQSDARIEAALISWRSARGPLRDVIDARRAALEVQMSRLDLYFDQSRHFIQLNYLGAYETASVEISHE